MKKRIKKATTWLMVVCMFIGFVSAFGPAAAAEEKPIQSCERIVDQTDLAAPQSTGEFQELSSDNLFDLLLKTLKAIAENIRSLSVDELLNLPANAMDDVVTYFFAVFKILGLNIDSLYEKLTSIFFFQ